MKEYKLKYTGAEVNEKLATMATVSYVDNAINNSVINVVQTSGTSTADVMSQKAVTDYVTSKVSSIMPEPVDSVDKMTDPAKRYLYNDTIWVYGDTTIEPVNLFDPSKATLNARISSSGFPEWNGMFVSDYIKVDGLNRNSDIFYYKGEKVRGVVSNGGGVYVAYYNSSKTMLSRENLGSTVVGNNYIALHTSDDGFYYFYPLTSTSMGASVTQEDVAYVRFGLETTNTTSTQTGGTAITVNDIADVEIYLNDYKGTVGKGFYDTGMAWSMGGSSSVAPDTVDSVDQMTNTKKQYILKETGTIWVYGETMVEVEPENMFDASAVSLNTRLATSAIETMKGYFTTPALPLPDGWSSMGEFKVRISGLSSFSENARIWFVGDDPSVSLQTYYLSTDNKNSAIKFNQDTDGSVVGNILTYYTSSTNPSNNISSAAKGAKAIRICLYLNNNVTNITQSDIDAANISIIFDSMKGATQLGEAWYDTGLEWSAGSEGLGTVELAVKVNANTAAITKLENTVSSIGNGNAPVSVPSYWESKLDSVVESVKEKQIAGGVDVINFCWFSDLHYVPTSNYVQNVGKLCAAVMRECDIPFTLFTGDTTTASGLPAEKTLLDYIDAAQDMLSPIGHENLLTCWGNHDDVWGTYTPSSGSTVHFVNKIDSQKMWYHMHRHQAKDTRRHYGSHGTYFYIDDNPRRVRFICLNCQFYDGDAINSTTGQMTGNYGAEQLEWLENIALDLPAGYSAIIAMHNPPTAKSINGNTYYLSQISDGNELRNIIQASTADIIAIFAGHCHADAFVSGDLKCPIVTITSAVNTPYDAEWSTRVAGTDTETVIDVVTINKKTKKINCTRLGYGSDREISY